MPKTVHRAQYGSAKAKETVWTKAKPVRGKDPDVYRQDPYGNVMYKQSYGKHTDMGWQVDHIKPKARGGSNDIVNLQALNTKINESKSACLVKKSRHCNK